MGAKLWVTYVPHENTPLIPHIHCTEEHEYVFNFEMQRTEGQSAEFQVTTWEYGWKRLADLNTRFALASWSPTGASEDAKLIARGYRTELPGDFGQDEQVVRYRCERQDMETFLLGQAQAQYAAAPYTDLRFSDAPKDDPQTYLMGRCADWYVDPVTHQIRLSDTIVGKRVIDLSAHVLGAVSDSPGSFEEPVTRLTARVEVTWTQEASGILDISSRIEQVVSFDPAVGGRVSGSISSNLGEGWSLAKEPKVQRIAMPPIAPVGGSYDYVAEYKTEVWRPVVEKSAGTYPDGSTYPEKFYYAWQPLTATEVAVEGEDADEEPPLYTRQVSTYLHYERYRYVVQDVVAAFDYAQPRRETLTISLSAPVHPALVNRKKEEVVTDGTAVDMDLTLVDPADDSVVDALEIGKNYLKGDLVTINGVVYRAAYDQVGRETWPPGEEPWIKEDGHAARVRILDVDGGKSIVEHVLLRMRKQILRSARAKNLTFTVPWEIGWQVTTEDSASILVPWDEETDRIATGKVVSTRLLWTEEGDATVAIEIGICFGGDPLQSVQDAWSAVEGMSYAIANPPPVVVPVDHTLLGSSFTATRKSRWVNDATTQQNEMVRLRSAGLDPTQASVVKATSLDVAMVPLTVKPELARELKSEAVLLAVPVGIDLSMEDA